MQENKPVVRKPYRKLQLTDHVLICRAFENQPGLSINQLAKQLNLDPRTVSKALKYKDIQPIELLKAAEKRAVNGWVRAVPIAAGKGDHRPSRDLLLYTRAIEPLQANAGSNITILFGSTGTPGITLQSGNSRDSILQIPSNSADSEQNVTVTAAAEQGSK